MRLSGTLLRCTRWSAVPALFLIGSGGLNGQSSREDSGFYLYERVDATSNQVGFVTRLDSSIGYKLNRYFAVDAGLPVYAVRPSESALSTSSVARVNGIGNARIAGHFLVMNPAVDYLSSLTVTAPTGDKDKGLSTGHVTYDWNNHLDRSFGRLTPFGDVGIANTVSDTPFFIRPFTSTGFVAHLTGGVQCRLLKAVGVGALAYTIRPSGEQTVVSRVRPKDTVSPPGQSAGHGRGRGVFESAAATVGPAEIARDRGGSTWLSITPSRLLEFQLGYTRSTTYSLNTVYFGAGINLGSLIRKGGW